MQFFRILAAFVLSFFAQVAASHETVERDRTVVFETVLAPPEEVHFNWFAEGADFHRGAAQAVLEPLFFATTDQVGLQGWLAHSFTLDDTETEYRISLRPGVRWSDRKPFTAHDVVFSIQMVIDDARLFGPHVQAVRDAVASVEALDRQTVGIILTSPDHRFLHRHFSASDGLSFPIVPEHVWSGIDDVAAYRPANPTGTGPFRLMEIDHDTVRWERVAWWGASSGWKPRPEPHWLDWRPPVSEADRPHMIVAGEIDAGAAIMAPVANAVIAAAPHVGVWPSQDPRSGATCGFNLTLDAVEPALEHPDGRDALFRLLDRARLVRRADLYGGSVPSDSFLPDAADTREIRDALGSTMHAFLRPGPSEQAALAKLSGFGCVASTGLRLCRGEAPTIRPHQGTTVLQCPVDGGPVPLNFDLWYMGSDRAAEALAAELALSMERYGICTTLKKAADQVTLNAIEAETVTTTKIERRRCHESDEPLATLQEFLRAPLLLDDAAAEELRMDIAELQRSEDSVATALSYSTAEAAYRATPLLSTAALYPYSTLRWTGWPRTRSAHGHWSQQTHLLLHGLMAADLD